MIDGKVVLEIVVAYIHGGKVGLGFIADDGVEIARGELLEEEPKRGGHAKRSVRQQPFCFPRKKT